MSSIKDKLGYVPSHNMTGKYAILMETSGEENESWYYFIKYEGNEENLKDLQSQLEKIEFYIIDDLSTFDLELEFLVSAQTAKEMTKVDLNHSSFHRKFDGVLEKIDFDFKKKDGNETKICKVFDIIGMGQIENFIDDEDLDEEDLASEVNTENESISNDDDSNDEDSNDEDSNDEDSNDEGKDQHDDKESPKTDLKAILKEKIKNKK